MFKKSYFSIGFVLVGCHLYRRNDFCHSCNIKMYNRSRLVKNNIFVLLIAPFSAGLYGRTIVHLSTRPPPSTYLYFNGTSSESVHEIDGLPSSTVQLRPSRTNNHGLSSEFVHEVDGLSSSGRPPPLICGK